MVKQSRNISVFLKTVNGTNLEFSLPAKSSVGFLKTMVAERERIATNLQRIIFAGRELSDDSTLDGNSVRDRSQLFVVLRMANIQVMVKTLKDRVFMVTAEPSTTVLDLKNSVNAQEASWEVARQRIIFQGKELEDSALVSQCGLDEGTPTVHVVMRLPSPGTARRGKKEETAVGNVKGKASQSVVEVKEEVLDPTESLGDLDEFLGPYSDSPLAMDLDTTWTGIDEAPSPEWDELKLPTLGAPEDIVSSVFSAPSSALSPSALSVPAATSASSSFADMVANVKTEEGEELPMPSSQGRAYDLDKVDDKLRKRLLKNRLSAERSRQRKQAHVESLEFELSCCRSENEHLKQRVATLEAQLAAMGLNNHHHVPQRTQIAA